MHLASAIRSATCYATGRAASFSGVFRGLRSQLAGLCRLFGEPFCGPRPWVSWVHCVCSTPLDAAVSTVTSLARFLCLVLWLPLDTVLGFCRLDRPDGNGSVP